MHVALRIDDVLRRAVQLYPHVTALVKRRYTFPSHPLF